MWLRLYDWALAVYVTIDIWLYHRANEIEAFIARRH